jgi:hypothetical protein
VAASLEHAVLSGRLKDPVSCRKRCHAERFHFAFSCGDKHRREASQPRVSPSYSGLCRGRRDTRTCATRPGDGSYRPSRALYEDGHTGGDYVLTGPESLSQAEQVSVIGAALGRQIRFEEMSPEEFRRETAGRWPGQVVDMLLAAWGATIGRPAFVTSTVADVVGSPARTFRQWAADHADAFRGAPAREQDR